MTWQLIKEYLFIGLIVSLAFTVVSLVINVLEIIF